MIREEVYTNNTPFFSMRLTHLPTGIIVEKEGTGSQYQLRQQLVRELADKIQNHAGKQPMIIYGYIEKLERGKRQDELIAEVFPEGVHSFYEKPMYLVVDKYVKIGDRVKIEVTVENE